MAKKNRRRTWDRENAPRIGFVWKKNCSQENMVSCCSEYCFVRVTRHHLLWHITVSYVIVNKYILEWKNGREARKQVRMHRARNERVGIWP